MRIVIAFDWFLKLVVEGQARALRDLGHDVLLLCRDHSLEFGGSTQERAAILDDLRSAGIERIELPGRRYGPEGLPAVAAALRRIGRWAPDVVSAHENHDPRLLLATVGLPLVYTVHDPEPHPGANAKAAERFAGKLWMLAARRLVVHGAELVARLPSHGARRKSAVVPLGIEVAREPLPAPAVPTVLLFGRLEPYKGVPVLMEAMRRVWEHKPETRVVIAGRGSAARDVLADPRVRLSEGYVPEAEVPGLLRAATVLVLPYTQASQSAAGLLGIAAGVPTVVTRTGALPEIALDERYIAEPRDPASLAQRLLEALNASAAERERVLAFARASFSWPVVAERYLAVYDEAIRAGVSKSGSNA